MHCLNIVCVFLNLSVATLLLPIVARPSSAPQWGPIIAFAMNLTIAAWNFSIFIRRDRVTP